MLLHMHEEISRSAESLLGMPLPMGLQVHKARRKSAKGSNKADMQAGLS